MFVSLGFFGAPEKQTSSPVPKHSSLRKDGGTYSTLHCGGCLCSDLGGAEFGGFFQGHTERLEWNSQKFTTNKNHDIRSAEPMGDTRLQMEFVDPVNEQYHKSGSGLFQRKG